MPAASCSDALMIPRIFLTSIQFWAYTAPRLISLAHENHFLPFFPIIKVEILSWYPLPLNSTRQSAQGTWTYPSHVFLHFLFSMFVWLSDSPFTSLTWSFCIFGVFPPHLCILASSFFEQNRLVSICYNLFRQMCPYKTPSDS